MINLLALSHHDLPLEAGQNKSALMYRLTHFLFCCSHGSMYERLKNAGVKYTDLNNIESVIGVGGQALTNTVIFDEIKIGDYIIKNVVARVMLEDNSSLLGTGFLLKFSDAVWKMQEKKLILYK